MTELQLVSLLVRTIAAMLVTHLGWRMFSARHANGPLVGAFAMFILVTAFTMFWYILASLVVLVPAWRWVRPVLLDFGIVPWLVMIGSLVRLHLAFNRTRRP